MLQLLPYRRRQPALLTHLFFMRLDSRPPLASPSPSLRPVNSCSIGTRSLRLAAAALLLLAPTAPSAALLLLAPALPAAVLLLPRCWRPKLNHDLFFFMPANTAKQQHRAVSKTSCIAIRRHTSCKLMLHMVYASPLHTLLLQHTQRHSPPTIPTPPHPKAIPCARSRLRPVSPGSCTSRSSATCERSP